MSIFSPMTFSCDWENFVVDRLHRCVPTTKLHGFAGELHAELGLPITVDKQSLEFPLGINSSFSQIWERITRVTDRARQLLRAYELELFPAAAHPIERTFNSSHIHVGTLHDESMGIRLEQQLMHAIPAFAALAANSPVSQGMYCEFKSYRVQSNAHHLIAPSSWRDPRVSQYIWGTDATPKLDLAPTLEIRVTDCASSRRLLAEMATFIAAYVHYQAKHLEEQPVDPQYYRDYLINRWCAARDGMQATVQWNGHTQPVAEMLDAMLDACAEELSVLGTSRSELVLINLMIEKRLCQADMVITLAMRYPDPYQLASAYGKMLCHWEWFDEFLMGSTPYDPRPALSEQELLDIHVQAIGEGTYFYRTREVMSLPPTAADELLARMIADDRVRRDELVERGTILSRI